MSEDPHNSRPSLPFSETRPDLGRIIRSLPAPEDVTLFRTDKLEYAESGLMSWCQARLNPDDNSWTVIRFDTNKGLARTQEIMMRGVCFFDALYCCAWHQMTDEGMGKMPALDVEEDGAFHYRDVGTAAFIPFEGLRREGLPGVVSNGDILTGKMYDEAAYALAAQHPGGRGNAAYGLLDTLKPVLYALPVNVDATDEDLIARAEAVFGVDKAEQEAEQNRLAAQARLYATFNEAAQGATAIVAAIREALVRKFKVPSLLNRNDPFYEARAEFLDMAGAFPDPESKALLATYDRAAGQTFLLEKIAGIGARLKAAKDPGGNKQDFKPALKEGFAAIDRLVAKEGFGIDEGQRLKLALTNGDLARAQFANDKDTQFFIRLKTMRDELEKNLIERRKLLFRQTPEGQAVPADGSLVRTKFIEDGRGYKEWLEARRDGNGCWTVDRNGGYDTSINRKMGIHADLTLMEMAKILSDFEIQHEYQRRGMDDLDDVVLMQKNMIPYFRDIAARQGVSIGRDGAVRYERSAPAGPQP